ncbi:hypothetical protein HAX54_015390 [Datura stramonium]|uniref:Uncharacterized protein n=1 Tax=Datura stramonium TaxID=4076 RepID=A0ABS8TPJ1_DATST|nr:hypothetical protein [Datura stramonium]
MEWQFNENDIHHSKIAMYLATSEYFLKHHNFEDCCNYALKAIEIDPNQTVPSQIYAIAKKAHFNDELEGKGNEGSFQTIVGPPTPPEVAENGENYCLGFYVLGKEGKSPFVRKNDDDFDGDEKFLGDGSKVITNEIIYDEGSKREKKIEVERNHDYEFHNEKNDDYYVVDEDDINMAL